MAVMQRHIEHDKRRPLPWSSRCCFITVAVVLIPGPCVAGRICRPDYRTEALYRRVPLVDITVVPDDVIVQHRRVALWS